MDTADSDFLFNKNRAEVTIEENDELTLVNQFGSTTLRWKNDFDNKNDYFDILDAF